MVSLPSAFFFEVLASASSSNVDSEVSATHVSRSAVSDASFEIAESVDEEDQRTIKTKEDWGHPKMVIKTTYTFTKDNKILKMES